MPNAIKLAAAIVVFLVSGGIARAGGGVYVDSVKITNDKTVVLTDSFETQGLKDWAYVRDGAIECDEKKSRCGLHLNDGVDVGVSCANHRVTIDKAGAIDFTTAVYLTPLQEQSPERLKVRCDYTMSIFAKDSRSRIEAEVQMGSGSKPHTVGIRFTRQGDPFNAKQMWKETRASTLTTGKWTEMTLRLDPKTNTAWVLLDKRPVFSRDYDSASLPSINLIGVSTGFGDGLKHPDSIDKG